MTRLGHRIGHIRLVDHLGAGGMGQVYVGFDETLERKVALKAIHRRHRLSAAARARFLREARILSRLDHPNICRIYDYVEHDEEDLLVLELIEGRNLAELPPDDLEPQTRLDIAIQIARVLAAAHGESIVHRDLKPDNVMVTPDGDVKVLDFGISRQEHRKEPRTSPSAAPRDPPRSEDVPLDGATLTFRPPPAETLADDIAEGATLDEPSSLGDLEDGLATEAGGLIGTPLYMSPEQARGEGLTTASDMYSFGLLMQTLWTGERPYPPGLGADQVVARAAAADTLPVTGAPSDVAALIERLKAPAPANRPTAVAALERLEWIRDKPKRRARRLVVAAVLALMLLGGVKYTVDLRDERAIAVEARTVADQRRQQAEGLIGFMLGDLRSKLEPVGRLEILDDVGDRAREYFASVPEDELSDEELAQRATALYQIGEVRLLQGDLAAAMEVFQESLDLAESLVEREPGNPDRLLRLGNSQFWVANVHWRRGDLDSALRGFQAYRATARSLAETDPSNLEWQMELVHGEGNVAWMLREMGDHDTALEHLETRLEILQRVVSAAPEREDWQRELASTHVMAGTVKEARGDLRGALGHYRSDLEVAQRLSSRDPGHSGWRQHLAVSHSYLGTALENRGDVNGALEHFRASLSIAEDLVRLDPSNTQWLDTRATAHANLGRAQVYLGDEGDALRNLRAAVDQWADLVSTDPTKVRSRRRLAAARIALGKALASGGDPRGAEREAQAAAAQLDELITPESGDPLLHRLMSESLLLTGASLEARGRMSEAQDAWQKAHDVLRPTASDSRDGAVLAPFAMALLKLGRHDEAEPVLARLRDQGFERPDLASAVTATAVPATARGGGPSTNPTSG